MAVWLALADDGELANWDAPVRKAKKRGRQPKYSDHAIETPITLGMVLHLRLRQTEGFLRSLFGLLKFDNDVPDHTTVSKRKAKLGKVAFHEGRHARPVHILIDSSGLIVHVGQMRKPPRNSGPAMRARRLASQRVEASIGCKILNRMTALGIPDGYMMA